MLLLEGALPAYGSAATSVLTQIMSPEVGRKLCISIQSDERHKVPANTMKEVPGRTAQEEEFGHVWIARELVCNSH